MVKIHVVNQMMCRYNMCLLRRQLKSTRWKLKIGFKFSGCICVYRGIFSRRFTTNIFGVVVFCSIFFVTCLHFWAYIHILSYFCICVVFLYIFRLTIFVASSFMGYWLPFLPPKLSLGSRQTSLSNFVIFRFAIYFGLDSFSTLKWILCSRWTFFVKFIFGVVFGKQIDAQEVCLATFLVAREIWKKYGFSCMTLRH